MKAFIKCLIAGAIFIAVGLIVLLIGFATNEWSLNPEFTEATYTQESESIENLNVRFASGEFELQFYDGDKIEIEYYTCSVYGTTVEENDGTLTFKNQPRWGLGLIFYKPPKTLIKLPQGNVYNLDLDMSAGVLKIPEGQYGNINLDMSAGLAQFKGSVTCEKFDLDLSAGRVEADSITCTSSVIDLSAGSIDFKLLNCPVIDIDLSAGSVNIKIDGKQSDYSIAVDRSAGSCNVGGQAGSDPAKKIDIDISAGSVNIYFAD